MEQTLDNIRNFCIIAHVDHGKTTLSDRILELTHAVSARELKEQTLDAMDLERERGITIKSHPVSMEYHAQDGKTYLFNLLDTPGHVDFAYEVSRSMGACEGALLVVDAAQGVEAQTVANTYFAMDANLEIVPVLNKVDLPGADVKEVSREIEDILAIPMDDPLLVSAKTGVGCPDVLEAIVKRIPPPKTRGADAPLRALVFDSVFDEFRGVITYVRVVDGSVKAGQGVTFMGSHVSTTIHEVGIFSPGKKPVECLSAGQVGYLVGTVKDPSEIKIGDTVTTSKFGADEALPASTTSTPPCSAASIRCPRTSSRRWRRASRSSTSTTAPSPSTTRAPSPSASASGAASSASSTWRSCRSACGASSTSTSSPPRRASFTSSR